MNRSIAAERILTKLYEYGQGRVILLLQKVHYLVVIFSEPAIMCI